MHEPKFQKRVLTNEIEVILNEINRGSIRYFHRCVEIHPINAETENVEEIASWIKSTRKLKKIEREKNIQDMRNIFFARCLFVNDSKCSFKIFYEKSVERPLASNDKTNIKLA